MKPTIITDISCIITNPDGHDLIAVKVTTDIGIIGWGCATFQQRSLVVKTAIDEYLKPLLIGRDANNIEDLWYLMTYNSYWRNGPVLNNAISGIDMALWDIKGKLAGMPLYQLFGGKSKDAIACYSHASGSDIKELFESIDGLIDKGYRHIRCQLGFYGGEAKNMHLTKEGGRMVGAYYDQDEYMNNAIEMFKKVREKYGNKIHILHDVHERLYPSQAINFSKECEKFNLYWLEDIISPEQSSWLTNLRTHSSTPIALGELFVNPAEWRDLVINRKIDFIRCHISDIGGITPALKMGALCEMFGVRIGLHGPPDLTGIGVAVNTHLNVFFRMATVQEYTAPKENTRSVFPDAPIPEGGYMYPIDRPGIGVEMVEEMALKYPAKKEVVDWTQARLPNGSIFSP